jgi:hypothetical protein
MEQDRLIGIPEPGHDRLATGELLGCFLDFVMVFMSPLSAGRMRGYTNPYFAPKKSI